MRQPHIRSDLPELGTDLSRDLSLHQLPRDQSDRLAHEILRPTITHLRNDIGNRHPSTIGHRGVSNRLTARTADEFGATVADPLNRAPTYPTLVTPLLPKRPPRSLLLLSTSSAPEREVALLFLRFAAVEEEAPVSVVERRDPGIDGFGNQRFRTHFRRSVDVV